MKKALIIFFSLISLFVDGQSVLINEFMAKNNITIQDEDGDFSDWIELYNASNSTISLLNYSLSDDNNELDKWVFPEITILPHSYLLVFASDKNRLDTCELHTNFKISASGEELYLSNNSGAIIDQTNAADLSSDESYGRIPDGHTNWFVINTPSPNSSNNSSNRLLFSHQQGFYTASLSLKIYALTADTIYYTLNGDIPTESTNIFTDSILVNDINPQANILSEIPTSPDKSLLSFKGWESPPEISDKATILRFASYNNGTRTSKIYTKTFFVGDEILEKYTIPVISLVTEYDNLFNFDSGIFVPGVYYDSTNPEWSGNYFRHGDNWERDVHIEYFENNGDPGFSQDAGLRIHGGKTRHAAQKSLRLYARNEYGEKYFNYKLFPQKQVNTYKRFILRTTMGAWGGQTIIKDLLAQNISSSLNIDYQDFQAVIVYINGEYWGIHTIRDRIDERYVEYTHGINEASVEFREPGNIAYENLMEFIGNNSLEYESNYEYVTTQIDIDNYIDYTIAELFFANYDWPANNMKLWREIPDGKWRWVLYDLDAGFGNESYNMFAHASRNDSTITWPNSPSSTFLFRNLIKNEMFKSLFVARYAEILNTYFDAELMKNKLDSIKGIYSPEILSHIGRWNYPDSYSDWEEDIENDLSSFIENRPCVIREQIMAFFNLTDFDFYCNPNFVDNKVDNMLVVPNPNNGNFFLSNAFSNLMDATITITNINGQVVYKENKISLEKNEIKTFDLSGLPGNLYLMQIISNDYSEQKKIMITN